MERGDSVIGGEGRCSEGTSEWSSNINGLAPRCSAKQAVPPLLVRVSVNEIARENMSIVCV